MKIVNRLIVAASGMHIADQIAIVSVPIIAAVVFNASAKTIGLLVALQSMAYLVGSLPFGAWVDKANLRSLLIISAIISIGGCAGAALSIEADSLLWFGVSIFFAGFGIVLFMLASLSTIPSVVPSEILAKTNASFEIPRAVTSFAIPLLLGLVISLNTANWIFVFATVSAACAAVALMSMQQIPRNRPQQSGVLYRLITGGAFVVQQKLLLAISLCAIFWNLAFAALIVVMVPLLVDVYHLSPNVFAKAMSALGLGMIAGSWLIRLYASRIPANFVLLFGPGSSVLAALCLLPNQSLAPTTLILIVFFFLGFGPSMWLVAQNTVRQLVTPNHMLGSVNAVIQTAIYGTRPLGALLGGLIVEAGILQGLVFVIIAFALSFVSALFSDLRLTRNYTSLARNR